MVRLGETTGLRIANAVFYVLMVAANFYIEMLPLNQITTKSISDANTTLLTPPGFTFMIWGAIYTGLSLYILYQFGLFSRKREATNPDLIRALGSFFMISCFLNVFWLVVWHYQQLELAFLLIFTLWITLLFAYSSIRKEIREPKEKWLVQYPIGMYLSWITTATIVNALVVLYKYRPDLLDIPQTLWAGAALAVIFGMSMYYVIKHKDYIYGITSMWIIGGLMFVYYDRIFRDDTGTVIFLLLSFVAVVLFFTILIAGWLQHNKTQIPESSRNRDFYN